ncbi:MAG TPA: BRO family protein [Noviherbaspirillum sp.]|nr:BRO family protein [Noviherbaspirillum sp.]
MNISTEHDVFKFDNHWVRTFLKDGEPWFSANDVCGALGLENPRKAISNLDADEKGVTLSDTVRGKQKINVISESGLYTVILRCRNAVKPGTVPYRFRKWVTGEVLPAIRKTGQYKAQTQPVSILSRRWLVSFSSNGQEQFTEVPLNAAIIDPAAFGDLSTLINEYVPISLLNKVVELANARMGQFIESQYLRRVA